MKLRIGIIGAGNIVRSRHLPGLKALSNVEIKCVCNRRRETAECIAHDFEIPEVLEDWTTVVAREDLDIIWIGTTPNLHAPITLAALKAGKHVFCQARMAMNLEEAVAMREASRQNPHLVTMLCPPPHGMKHNKHLQRLLKKGYIGTLQHIRLQALSSVFSNPTFPAHWRQQVELSGLNMLTVGIYAEVLQRWLGSPESLMAQTRVAYPKRGDTAITIPDTIQVLARWANGVDGTLEWSGISHCAPSERLELYGTEGTLIYDFTTDQLLGARKLDYQLEPLFTMPEELEQWTVERDFISAVVNKTQRPEPSFETGVTYMAFTEAIHQSARENRRVQLLSH